MNRITTLLFSIVTILSIAACNEGGSGGVGNLTLSSNLGTLSSGGSESATITATVKDSNNQTLEGVDVSFSVNNNGSIQVFNGTTDNTGQATATVSTPGFPQNRTLTITATAGTSSDAVSIFVTGTTIRVDGSSSAALGSVIPLTVTVQDGDGNPVSNELVNVTSALGNTIGTNPITTDFNGNASVNVTATVGGSDTITVSGLGLAAQFSLTVDNSVFDFTAPLPVAPATVAEVPLNTPDTVRVHYAIAGANQPNVTVYFATTRGTLSASSAVTDAAGVATVTIQSDNSGPALIEASVTLGPSAQYTIEFIADSPSTIDVSADPANIGSGGESSTITAVVRDITSNPVKGERILFNLFDITGGTLSQASSTTDSLGRASTVYTSSSGVSGTADVTATVDGTAINNTVSLTIADQPLYIAFGTGNDLIEIPGVTGNTRVGIPFSVVVTDASGVGMANADVQISVRPLIPGPANVPGNDLDPDTKAFRKGVWVGVDTSSPPDGNADDWGQIINAYCNTDDLDGDGSLSPVDVDVNGNGTLEPGNVAAVTSPVITDATGFAEFLVTYPKEYAYWASVTIEATANVAGSEGSHKTTTILLGLADDYKWPEAIPGEISPFGTGVCADPS